MKKFYLILLLCASFAVANAVPAYPGLLTTTQSDGTTISYYLHGDEYFSYKTTEDGYLIADNGDGVFEYAYFLDDCSVRTYGMKAHNVFDRSVNEQNFVASLSKPEASMPKIRAARQQRMPSSVTERRNFPLTGSPRGLIILVGYSDIPFGRTNADFVNLANLHDYSANGGTGSIQDYFVECSNGQFSPVFDVFGPYTLPHERAYYGAMSGDQHDVRAGQMIIDACVAADDDVNFADYDTDKNGFVDNVFVVFAGNNQADGGPDESIWPHRSSLSYYNPPQLDGVTPADYACTSEYKHASGTSMCGIGTFCHEFGHVLGLPDFYDTDYDKGLDAMGLWDIMSTGSRNNDERTPPTYTAYERFFLGWLTPTPLVNDSTVDCEGSYVLKSLISSNSAFIISDKTHNLNGAGPNPKEFFMLEYRKMEGRDTYTGLANGLLITHINYNSSTWHSNGPNNDASCLGYYPVLPNRQAAYGNDRDLYPTVADHCEFTLHGAEEPLLRRLLNIVDNDTACAFDYASPNEVIVLEVKDIDAYCAPTETQFVVIGTSIAEDLNINIRDNREFLMRRHTADGSGTYRQSLTLTPDSNGVIMDTVDVKYSPTKITYDEYMENRFSAKGTVTSSLTKFAKFRYRNRRPVYVTVPEAYEPETVNATSATLTWSFVADTTQGTQDIEKYGAKYYLDVYTLSDQPQTQTEGFENFPAMLDDWTANFTTSSNSARKAGQRSALFTTAQDTLWTKEFVSDILYCSFWIQSQVSEGTFYVDVQDTTGAWKRLKIYTIEKTTTLDEKLTMKAGFRRLRFYYEQTSATGSLAIDEVSVQTATSIDYLVKNEYLRDTSYVMQNLQRETEYRFKVRATDRDEYNVDKPRYENITGFSNEVVFRTNDVKPIEEDEDLSIVVVKVEGTNRYMVYVSEVKEGDYKLFVYNLNGMVVDIIPVTGNSVMLPQLPVGQYILRYSKDDDKSNSGPTAKFHYTSYFK